MDSNFYVTPQGALGTMSNEIVIRLKVETSGAVSVIADEGQHTVAAKVAPRFRTVEGLTDRFRYHSNGEKLILKYGSNTVDTTWKDILALHKTKDMRERRAMINKISSNAMKSTAVRHMLRILDQNQINKLKV